MSIKSIKIKSVFRDQRTLHLVPKFIEEERDKKQSTRLLSISNQDHGLQNYEIKKTSSVECKTSGDFRGKFPNYVDERAAGCQMRDQSSIEVNTFSMTVLSSIY